MTAVVIDFRSEVAKRERSARLVELIASAVIAELVDGDDAILLDPDFTYVVGQLVFEKLAAWNMLRLIA